MSITNATRLSDFAAGIGTEGAILKIDNANQRVGIGTQLPNQMLTVAGIVSATQYIGDGSQLEGITSAGLGTAIDETEGSAGAVVYYTDDLLTVAETTTINPPASASAAYTQYRDVKLDDSVDLIIETGDDFIPDVLGLGTAINDVSAAGNGVFDEVYSSIIKNKDGLGAPAFANGLTSVGVITATGGFSGNVTGNLTGTASNASGATGDFGVGTASPTARLDVRRGDTDGKIAEIHQSTGYGIDIGSSEADAYISSGYLQNFIFKTNRGTGQLERLRINKEGAIGLAGANYGTSGQVLTSQGNSAAPQWATAAGGAWEVVSTHALSGSTSDLQLYGWSNTYAIYKIVFQDCYHASGTRMRLRFYMDATSGNNGTLQTGNSYRYSTDEYTIGAAPIGVNRNNGQPYYYIGEDSKSTFWTGELEFPMKTAAITQDAFAYGWFHTSQPANCLRNFDVCEYNVNSTQFVTGVHLYWSADTAPNPISPSNGRVTLLRMKYS